MDEEDRIRLKHIVDACIEAEQFITHKTRASLNHELILVRALMQTISIVGEAAARISKETQASFPYIPWREIIGMRNRIVHVYFNINLDILWQTASIDLPLLHTWIQEILDHTDT